MNAQPQPQAPVVDPWVVKVAKQTEPLPVGQYVADFKGVADYTLPGTTDVRWRWAWTVATGDKAGKEASALTNQSISPNTLPGRLIEGLLGTALKDGDHVKGLVDACVGKRYLVSVQGGVKGGKPGVKAVFIPPAM
jgi:hypothetical protein